jgi:hypothetical protein
VIGEENIQLAGARVEWIDAGHFVYFEQAEPFVRLVEKFLSAR